MGVLRRAEERGRKTGRYVPKEMLLESMQQVPRSVKGLAPHADFVCRVHNSGEPTIEREPGAPFPSESVEMNWDLIKELWQNVDLDGDGQLSPYEIKRAICKGILTNTVVETLDTDHNGAISVQEIQVAKRKSWNSGYKKLRGNTPQKE